jgi:cytochrome b
VWGVVGSRHARFSNFVRSPGAVAAYLKTLLQARPRHYTGHNPAGAVAIVGLLTLALAVSASGYATYNDLAGEWVQELHEVTANLMLAIVGIHIAGVLLASWLHRENLVGAMFTGRKQGAPEDGIRRAWRGVAALLLTAVLALWWVQGQSALQSGNLADRPVSATRAADHDRDND